MTLHVDKNTLTIGDNIKVNFDFPIKQVLEVEGVIIVVLMVPPAESMTENVFGVSEDGNVLWQIERIPETSAEMSNRYMDVRLAKPGTVIAGNWNGMDVTVDTKTGRVTSMEFIK